MKNVCFKPNRIHTRFTYNIKNRLSPKYALMRDTPCRLFCCSIGKHNFSFDEHFRASFASLHSPNRSRFYIFSANFCSFFFFFFLCTFLYQTAIISIFILFFQKHECQQQIKQLFFLIPCYFPNTQRENVNALDIIHFFVLVSFFHFSYFFENPHTTYRRYLQCKRCCTHSG